MIKIVVLIKQVPDTYSARKLSEADHTLDRESADVVIDEINERAVEEALKFKDAGDAEITVLTMGPDRATEAIRRALSMGADQAIHVSDPALRGTDMIGTATVLAAAIRKVGHYDLIIAGNEASDGTGGAVPAMLAELLDLPQLTHVRELTVSGTEVRAVRETDEGQADLQAQLPALVSVMEKVNEPRYPSFKGIMAAKKKTIDTLSLADLGIAPDQVGIAGAWSSVLDATPRPPRQAGERIHDEGDAGIKIAEYLATQKLI